MILDPGFELTLRPMKYPQFFDMYKAAIKNTWTVEEVDFSQDVNDLRGKLTEAENHLIKRLVAFFATGDSIVSNNLVLNLYKHVNSPEARMYLSRQLYEEALHVEFYLTLLDTYLPDHKEREEAFAAIHNIPSVRAKAQFALKWIDAMQSIDRIETERDEQTFMLTYAAFAAAIEGLFFFAAFAYVYFLRSKGLLPGLATGTNWVFRDESCVLYAEVMTPGGWKHIADLEYGEQVAQYDMKTGEVSFVAPSRIIKKEHSGDVVTLSHNKGGIQQTVTGDHDVVCRLDYQRQYGKVKAADFKPNAKRRIPVSGLKQGSLHKLSTLDRLRIAIQVNGNIFKRYTGECCGTVLVNFTFKKDRKKKRMRALLDDLGYAYKERTTKRAGATRIIVALPAKYKEAKESFDWVLDVLPDVSSEWAEEFIQELAEWDGSRPKTGRATSVIYLNNNKKCHDVVQMLAAMCNRHASINVDQKPVYAPTYRSYIQVKSSASTGTLRKSVHTPAEPVPVFCVTVPSGAILIREDDKVSVTGNCHMAAAFEVINVVRAEQPELFDEAFEDQIIEMIQEAIDTEMIFADDLLSGGVIGLSKTDMRQYLEYVADRRLEQLHIEPIYNVDNPFDFMNLQDVQELTNFFERRVSAYQVGVSGDVAFDEEF